MSHLSMYIQGRPLLTVCGEVLECGYNLCDAFALLVDIGTETEPQHYNRGLGLEVFLHELSELIE